jgi:hypothetical protein
VNLHLLAYDVNFKILQLLAYELQVVDSKILQMIACELQYVNFENFQLLPFEFPGCEILKYCNCLPATSRCNF